MNQPNHLQSPDEQPNHGGSSDEEDLIPLVPSSVPRTPNLGGKKKLPMGRDDDLETTHSASPASSPVAISIPPSASAPESAGTDESPQPNRRPGDAWSGGRAQPLHQPDLEALPLDDIPAGSAQPAELGSPAGATEPQPSIQEAGEYSGAPEETGDSTAAGKTSSGSKDKFPATEAEGSRLMPRDKTWLTILLAGLLIAGGGLYFFLRDGLPTKNAYQATSSPNLPIKGAKITVEDIELRWKDTGSNALTGNLNAKTLFPEAILRFAPQSTGTVRLFFKDERDHQIGDTVNFEVQGGRVGESNQNLVTCTEGLRSRIEYDDLRARPNASWTLEIWEGTDQLGPISGFTLLARIYLPWNLGASPHKP